MKTKILKNANYIGWIVIVMIFVFIYFSYFFIYIPKQESKLQQKGFRILREYGNNMFDKHKYFENHFKNYGLFYDIRFLVKSNIISKKNTNLIDKQYRKKGQEIENFISGLQEYVITTKETRDSSYFYNEKRKELFLIFNSAETDAGLVDSIKKYYTCNSSGCLDNLKITDFSYNIPINSFMANLKFDELFENIILFDDLNVSFNTNNSNLDDITNPKALCDSANKIQGGTYKTLNIRGEDKHIMIHPIDFVGKKFYIAGLITDTDYKNKTRTINKQLLIFVAGILLLVFAGMPILKIIFIDDRERLKASDASSSAVSLIFGIGLFILLIIAFSKKQFVDQSIQNQRVQMISKKLNSNITHDIDSLKTLGSSIAKGINSHYSSFADSVCNYFNSTVPFFRDSTLSCPFPLNEIFLISRNGIFTKGYTRTAFSDIVKVDLKERQYFKNIIDINNSWPTSDSLNFYIESIKSLNTSAVETAISFYTTNFDSLPVLAITSKVPSLYYQILPKDIEFVIINKRGKVLYHSIEEKNLHENFILECESDLKLINAINLQIEKNIQIDYNEKKWLAHIVPIKDTPLYHITLLDLNQADNKNARIFLFTFYFLIATLVFIIIGLILMRWIAFAKKGVQKNTWFLNWLILQPQKNLLYKRITAVLAVTIIAQLSGFFVVVNPIAVLLYQLIFIVYTLFVLIVILNRTESISEKSFYREFFTELSIFVAAVLLILFSLWKFSSGLIFLIPLVILVITTVFIYRLLKNYKSQESLPDYQYNVCDLKIKRTYLVFLFVWLTSISAVPVVVYYFSFKTQEEKSWRKEQLLKVAEANIELQSVYSHHNEEWYKRIQGNGIDFLNVSYTPGDKMLDSVYTPKKQPPIYANMFYASLPDPITNWYSQTKLVIPKNYVSSKFENGTLYFKKGLQKGAISVNYSNHKYLFSPVSYALLIFCVFIVIATCVWILLKYLASVLLNLNQEKRSMPEISWLEILNNTDNKRILLNSFNGSCFLEKSKEFWKLQSKSKEEIRTITASEMIAPDFKSESLPGDSKSIIWISGFNQIINEFDKHEDLLSILIKLNQNSLARVIVDFSFDIDLINEFYDDYALASDLKPEQLTHIFLLRKKWQNLFDGYLNFNGYLNQHNKGRSENIRNEDNYRTECINEGLNIQFSNIWSNLTSYEKIVLYDLADDGLLNRKNKTMIQKLINKRLIIPVPFPVFFSDEFRDFVSKCINSGEVSAIEQKLGLKGSWHNTKYLILLIIIALAAFIIISQGIAIEKVFGIFAGGLAIITGITRLFDSNLFKQ